jgi:TonB family protein
MKTLALAAVVVFTPTTSQAQIYEISAPGVTAPELVSETKPGYTPEAIQAGVAGAVEMTAVIDSNGTPTQIRVTRGLEPGLDRNAVAALAEWRFKPGMKDGRPVNVLVTVQMTFTLRDPRIYDKESKDVTAPVMLLEVKPSYTPDAIRDRIAGSVEVEGIVGVDGKLTGARVVRGLDAGLDRKAVEAAAQWTFKPATLEGRAVPYRVQLHFIFTLRDRS